MSNIDKTKEKLAHDIAVKHGLKSDDEIKTCPNCLTVYNYLYDECPQCEVDGQREGREDCPVIKAHCNYFSYQCDSNGEIAISHCGHDDNQSDYEGNCTDVLCPVIKTLKRGSEVALTPVRYQNSIADQILTALNFLRANELDNVTLHHDNPDFFGPNNIVTVSGHWTNHLDRDFTGETLLESLEKAVKAKQRATV